MQQRICAQQQGPFIATGISLGSLINNTFSWENEFALTKHFSLNGSIGMTVNKLLLPTNSYRKSSFNENLVNGNFFRIGPRVFIPLLEKTRVFIDINYVYSVFSQDVKYEVKDFYGSHPGEFKYQGKANGANGGLGFSHIYFKKVFLDVGYYACTYTANYPGYIGDFVPGFGLGRKTYDRNAISSYLLVSAKYKLN
jgi:hypothetical protein